MKRMFSVFAGASAIALLVHCKGEILTVGGADDAASPPPAASLQPPATDGGGPGGPEVWKGYFENFKFSSGSDHITLTLTKNDATGVVGTAFFGDPPALEPPTNPEIGYPVKYDDAGSWAPPEKFAYTIMNGSRQGSRVTFYVVPNELYKQWCELQTVIYPYYNGTPSGPTGPLLGYACLPNGAKGGIPGGVGCMWDAEDDAGPHPVDCGKLGLCELGPPGPGPCSCTATHCTTDLAAQLHNSPFHFDLQTDGDKISGSVTGLRNAGNVHLTRQ